MASSPAQFEEVSLCIIIISRYLLSHAWFSYHLALSHSNRSLILAAKLLERAQVLCLLSNAYANFCRFFVVWFCWNEMDVVGNKRSSPEFDGGDFDKDHKKVKLVVHLWFLLALSNYLSHGFLNIWTIVCCVWSFRSNRMVKKLLLVSPLEWSWLSVTGISRVLSNVINELLCSLKTVVNCLIWDWIFCLVLFSAVFRTVRIRLRRARYVFPLTMVNGCCLFREFELMLYREVGCGYYSYDLSVGFVYGSHEKLALWLFISYVTTMNALM